MANYPKFKNAPITEALIDIQVTLPPEIELKTLLNIEEKIKEKFPKRQERQIGKLEFKDSEGGKPELTPFSFGIDGYLFISDQDKKVVQARLEGFTFSKLKPYHTWNEFEAEAKYLWSLYLEIAKPLNIKRLAVKFTNRIDLPTPLDYKDYFRTTPEIANTLPQELTQYYMQLVMPYRNTGATAIVTQTIDYSPVESAILPLIFDIDVFQLVDLNPSLNDLWEILEQLRNIKNEIFFESITENTRRLFE